MFGAPRRSDTDLGKLRADQLALHEAERLLLRLADAAAAIVGHKSLPSAEEVTAALSERQRKEPGEAVGSGREFAAGGREFAAGGRAEGSEGAAGGGGAAGDACACEGVACGGGTACSEVDRLRSPEISDASAMLELELELEQRAASDPMSWRRGPPVFCSAAAPWAARARRPAR